jgi:hypothetical protein
MARLVIVHADGTCDRVWLVGEEAPDLVTVDRLARLQLALRRSGGRMRLDEVSEALQGLLDLTGLSREVGGQPESGEEPVGLEERVDPGDPAP